MAKPNQEQFETAKNRIIQRMNRVIRDTEQLIRDVLYWNDHVRAVKWPDSPPLDVEACRITVSKAREIKRLAIAEERIPRELWDALVEAASEELIDPEIG